MSEPSKDAKNARAEPTNLLAEMAESLEAELRASGFTVTDRPANDTGRCKVSFVPRRRRTPTPQAASVEAAADEPPADTQPPGSR